MHQHARQWLRAHCVFLFLSVFAAFLSLDAVFAQELRSDTLQTVEVTATRFQAPPIEQPVQVLLITDRQIRLTAARDLATLLSMHGLGHIRSYGPGMAGGVSQRGFGASSFQVIRDGFPLNNPILGQADLSLIPVSQLASAELAAGNASSAFGSAATGGSLILRSPWREGWSVGHERGSAGYVSSHAYFAQTIASWRLSTEGGVSSADNDFRYFDPLDEIDKYRVNNHFRQEWGRLGAVGQVRGWGLQTNLYWASTDRQVPNSILTGDSQSRQWDHDLRFTAVIIPSTSPWKGNAQVYQNVLRYRNPTLGEDSYNRIRSAAFSAEFDLVNRNTIDVEFLAGSVFSVVTTNNYAERPHRWAGNGALKALWEPVRGSKLYPAIRTDAIGDVGLALSPSLGYNQAILPARLHFRAQSSYNFTAPTLNDLYWSTGGNPDLKPERAAKIDVGLHLQLGPARFKNEVQTTVYQAKLTNGVLWQPGPNNMWAPINVQEVHSRGLEMQYIGRLDLGLLEWFGSATLVNSQAFVPKPRFEGDGAVDKQLRYTPEWTLRAQSGLTGKVFELAAEYTRTGPRFTTEDHSSPLDPIPGYHLLNATAQFWARLGSVRPEFKLTVSNTTDTKYESIAWYPMPGRQWMFGLVIRK